MELGSVTLKINNQHTLGRVPNACGFKPLVSYLLAVMGFLKMIFGNSGLLGLPTRVTLFLWAFSRQGATGVPLFTIWDSVAQYLETFRAGADPGSELSHLGLAPPRDRDLGRV